MIRKMVHDFKIYGIKEVMYFILSFFYEKNKYNTLYMLQRDKVFKKNSKAFLRNEIADIYRISMKSDLSLETPTRFTEKIQWLKIHDNTELKMMLADKYAVRSWVEKTIGNNYLVPLLGVWNDVKEINIDSLPNAFVIKANHGSGMNYIVKDKNKIDLNGMYDILKWWLKRPFWTSFVEPQYKDIPRRIIAEQYIEEMNGDLLDYKIHCINGKPLFIQCIGGRNLEKHTGFQRNYNMKWERLNWIFEDYPEFPYEIEKPSCLNEMNEIAKKLSSGFKYVRVDLYEIKGKVLFGEMTFTPASGIYPYKGTWTIQKDKLLGSKIDL